MTTEPSVMPERLVVGQDATEIHPGYLRLLDLFRVLACLAVVSQHSFIWTGMSHNVVGTGFITFLHFTRNVFFFLSALVVCYAQLVRPRNILGFWRRRFVQIGVPYLAWTGIYVIFTMLRGAASWHHFGSVLYTNLWLGYYQLYVVVVLFQFYLVCPLLMLLLRPTRHHMVILATSLAFAVFLGVTLHYSLHLGPITQTMREMDHWWPWSRELLSYQEYFVVGALVAFHLNSALDFLARHWRHIGLSAMGIGVVTMVWYSVVTGMGQSISSASDIYEPIAVLWSFGAVAGLLSASWWWSIRPPRDNQRNFSVTVLAELTGGIYLCHVLFINGVRAVLDSLGLNGHEPWPVTVGLLLVGTLVLGVTFTSLVARTPLRWVLGGPLRVEQRVEGVTAYPDLT
jgi:peptidoglycan/LPS O-acetylase OafA/YrhL